MTASSEHVSGAPTAWEYATVPLITHATKQILDQWGADGWELVQVVPGPSGTENLVAYLKRPRPCEALGADAGVYGYPHPPAPVVRWWRTADAASSVLSSAACGAHRHPISTRPECSVRGAEGSRPETGPQRARRRSRSTSSSVTARPSRRIQPRETNSASDLLTVSREAPTSWASSS